MSKTTVQLESKAWRLSNLYKIYDKQGNLVLFSPNDAQKEILKERNRQRLTYGYSRIVVVKARQLGVTTLACVDGLDECLFRVGKNIVIIAHGKDHLEAFFKKISTAFDSLPISLRRMYSVTERTKTSLSFAHGSSISVALSSRSATVYGLHVSELSYLDKHFPLRSDEVITGAFPSVAPSGNIIVESTARGIGGAFYELAHGAYREENGFKLLFFPWYEEPLYRLPVPVQRYVKGVPPTPWVPSEKVASLHLSIQTKTKHTLDTSQLYWYESQLKIYKDKMPQEFPSTFEEAFLASGNCFYNTEKLQQCVAVEKQHEERIYSGVLEWYTADNEEVWNYLSHVKDAIVGIDLAEGLDTGDYTVIRVRDRDLNVICSYRGKCKPDQIADVIDHIYKKGIEGIIAFERNKYGYAFLMTARERKWYHDLYREKEVDKVTNKVTHKYGWHTNMKTRPLMLAEHEQLFREGKMQIDKTLYGEMLTFFDIDGKPQAQGGQTDDVVMADAICVQMLRYNNVRGFYNTNQR